MFEVLTKQNVPDQYVNAIRQLYKGNMQFIQLEGVTSPSFCIKSGVRQGCPLSLILFALALDPVLVYLSKLGPQNTLTRAYADDIGIVLADVQDFDKLAEPFKILAEAANLEVNIGKTYLIPLFDATLTAVQEIISNMAWAQVGIELEEAKYLGFQVGRRTNATNNFRSAMVKFRDRAAYWLAKREVGTFFQVLGFEMFAASVLNFVGQLYTLPDAYAKEVSDISAKFMLGPGGWFKGRDNHPYFRAKVDLGMKAVPRCIVSQITATCYTSTRHCLLSAGARVGILHSNIGLDVTAAHVDPTISNSPFGHASRASALIHSIVDMSTLPQEKQEVKKIIYSKIFDHVHPKVTLFNRFDEAYRKRWCKPGCLNIPRPRMLSEKAINRLLWLSQHVPPRVHTANIRLHLNAWHTRRRYQQKGTSKCHFCGIQVIDSLEHIFQCDLVRSVFPTQWREDVSKCFFLSGVDNEVLLASILIYGIYAHHCAARHSSTPAHIESKASIVRLIGELSLSRQLSQIRYEHFNFHSGW